MKFTSFTYNIHASVWHYWSRLLLQRRRRRRNTATIRGIRGIVRRPGGDISWPRQQQLSVRRRAAAAAAA
jgi:hypothetical protein